MSTAREIIQPSTATMSPSEAEMDGEHISRSTWALARLKTPPSSMPIAY